LRSIHRTYEEALVHKGFSFVVVVVRKERVREREREEGEAKLVKIAYKLP
jgi:hypothetical protein